MCESRDKHGRRVYIFRLGETRSIGRPTLLAVPTPLMCQNKLLYCCGAPFWRWTNISGQFCSVEQLGYSPDPPTGRWDPDTIPVEQFYASAYVLLELMSREVKTQIAGITIVGDISGFSFKHIRNLGIEQLRQAGQSGSGEKCFQAYCCLPHWGIPSLGSQDPRR